MARFLGIDSQRFLHETFDDDTMIVDTVQGRLTLLVGVGPAVWDRVSTGTDVEEVLADVATRYGADASAEVAAFVDGLVELGLLIDDAGPAAPPAGPAAWPATFTAPGFEHYDDIADIMTMDPIHEVDTERGWPHRGQPHG